MHYPTHHPPSVLLSFDRTSIWCFAPQARRPNSFRPDFHQVFCAAGCFDRIISIELLSGVLRRRLFRPEGAFKARAALPYVERRRGCQSDILMKLVSRPRAGGEGSRGGATHTRTKTSCVQVNCKAGIGWNSSTTVEQHCRLAPLTADSALEPVARAGRVRSHRCAESGSSRKWW